MSYDVFLSRKDLVIFMYLFMFNYRKRYSYEVLSDLREIVFSVCKEDLSVDVNLLTSYSLPYSHHVVRCVSHFLRFIKRMYKVIYC